MTISIMKPILVLSVMLIVTASDEQSFTFSANEPLGSRKLGDLLTIEGNCSPDIPSYTFIDISFHSPAWENENKKLQMMLNFDWGYNWPTMIWYDTSPQSQDGPDLLAQRGRQSQTFTNAKVTIQITPSAKSNESSMFIFGNRQPEIIPIAYDHFRSLSKVTTGGDFAQPVLSLTFTSSSGPIARILETSIVPGLRPAPLEPVTITCIATGSPLLEVIWESEIPESKRGMYTNSTSIDTSHPDPVITTSLTMPSFNASHVGIWTCRIRNINFNTVEASQDFHLDWSHPVTLLSKPGSCLIQGEIDKLLWTIQGWPLEQVDIEMVGNDIKMLSTVVLSLETFPPRKTITILLPSNVNKLDVALHNEVELLDSCEIYRVGYNCSVGEYAIGDKCMLCPVGETSKGGGSPCHTMIEELCQRNQFWNGVKCDVCPEGTIANQPAAKVQDCQPVHPSFRTCGEGQYGMTESCNDCPRRSSIQGAVKLEECEDNGPYINNSTEDHSLFSVNGWGGAALLIIGIVVVYIFGRLEQAYFVTGLERRVWDILKSCTKYIIYSRLNQNDQVDH